MLKTYQISNINEIVYDKWFPVFNSNSILTKRDELSFLTVLALPNASNIGFACKSCDSSPPYNKKKNIKKNESISLKNFMAFKN